ncbi:hypothetical protein OIU80_01775 [Flavobacterium sp. LS1R47]|uniref:Uncharacterized protein n=1 Tax=Flavobacterium frigoritolerans TaxID=2987686 RepID=A0A9X3C7C4_9FLAO|nr:hypothetical protein [Flavobacterium frigoritolerans]MCV9931002.1 hypothetical protein [Flavobacterium frigoritolerans]
MFYYYSIVSKPLTSTLIEKETCPVCSKKGTIEVILYMKFAAAIIPMFGLGRPTSVHCTECGHEIKSVNTPILAEAFSQKKYSPGIINAIKNIKANHKRTLWQLVYPWSLMILLGIAMICGLVMQYSVKHTNSQNSEMLANPKIGDIYKVTIDSMYLLNANTMGSKNSQTLFKIVAIKNDTLLMVRNKQKKEGIGVKENEWSTFSRENNAFESIPHKISLKGIAENKELFEFFNQKKIDSINKTDLVKSTNPLHFSKSIARIPNFNGIEVVERK